MKALPFLALLCCAVAHAGEGRVRQCEQAAASLPANERAAQVRRCVKEKLPKPVHFPGGLVEGMSTDQVLRSAWGAPREVKRRQTPSGTLQEWVYDRGQLYFDANGKLASAR